jgi:hypothetical protein
MEEYQHLLDPANEPPKEDDAASPPGAVPDETGELLQACEKLLDGKKRAGPEHWPALVEHLLPADAESFLLTATAGWRVLPPRLQERSTEAAYRFLVECAPRTESWLDSGDLPWSPACAYVALLLLAQTRPAVLDRMPASAWKTWASVVVAFPSWPTKEEKRLRHGLLQRLTRHAREALVMGCRRLLASSLPFDRSTTVELFLQNLPFRNEALFEVALEKLRNDSTEPRLSEELLRSLLILRHPEAWAEGERLLASPDPRRRTLAAKALLTRSPESHWDAIWRLLEQDEKWGGAFLDELARGEGEAAIIAGMFSPEQLVDLYVWIERHPAPRSKRKGKKSLLDLPNDRHSLQATIWTFMTMVDSPGLCSALERLNRELPGQDTLRVALFKAQEGMRLRAWSPPSPDRLLALFNARHGRLVQSASQLLEVLCESLERFEAGLHGETPALEFLWNEWKEDGALRREPKLEGSLSNAVKRHLEADLAGHRVVVNREVEIRASERPTRDGQRVDIHVTAFGSARGGQDVHERAVIEVKGCWNKGLWTDMQAQLGGRYLEENACQSGLYLVGWFRDDEAPRHPERGRVNSIDEARQLLVEQARRLSTGGKQIRAYVVDARFRMDPGQS